MSRQVLAILLLATSASSAEVTPTEKVISLLEDLKTEVENDGQEEASIYDTFACFCQSMTEDKSERIKEEQDNVDTFNSDIETYTLTSKNKDKEFSEKSEEINGVVSKRKDTEGAREEVKGTYELNLADVTKGIAGLETAIEMLSAGVPGGAAFAQVKDTVKRTVVMADLLGLAHVTAAKKSLAAFMQVQDGQAPPPNTGSSDIIVVMNNLLTDFKEQKANLESIEGQAKSDHTSTMDALQSQEDSATSAKDDAERARDEADGLLADAKKGLEEEEAKLADDNMYLLDLTRKCELKAREFDQHSKARTEEIEALEKATTIIKDKVKDNADEAVKRAALLSQGKTVQKAEEHEDVSEDVSFIQVASTQPARTKLAGLLQRGRARESAELRAARVDRAATQLAETANRIKSPILVAFALKLRTKLAFDPFVKVRKLVQDLIQRLVEEATAEATKKGFCDVETAKAKHSRDVHQEEASRINSETELAEAQKATLEVEIEDLTGELAELEDALFKATKIRADEKAMNEETVSKSKAGLEAVNDAYRVLQDFYKKSAKNDVSLAQAKASPIDEDAPAAPSGGAYKGGQQKAGGILAMLDVIISDFERTVRVTTETEKNSLREFTEFERTTKTSLASKESQKSNAEAGLKATENQIVNNMDLLAARMKMLDDTLRELEELVPTCVDTGMSYAERVQKREEEIDALKKAMCMLDGENVEEGCPP